jgi:hypothetical protein
VRACAPNLVNLVCANPGLCVETTPAKRVSWSLLACADDLSLYKFKSRYWLKAFFALFIYGAWMISPILVSLNLSTGSILALLSVFGTISTSLVGLMDNMTSMFTSGSMVRGLNGVDPSPMDVRALTDGQSSH